MNRPVAIISALLPPKKGGLSEHTWNLARHLQSLHPVTVLTQTDLPSDAPFPVRPIVRDWHDIAFLRQTLDALPPQTVILWQYVPHMYGRGGANRQLPKLWRQLKTAGRRQIFITHEIAADLSWRPHWLWYALHHRWQWRQLAQCGDAVPISTERWIELWSARWPRLAHKFFLLPSPSGIDPEPVPQNHPATWRQQHQLPPDTRILTYFGTLNASKQFDWIVRAWLEANSNSQSSSPATRPSPPTALCVIGDRPNLEPPPHLKSLFLPLGFLPVAEVSRTLHATDLLALPFFDGVSERRTSLMAGLAHAIPVATTWGHNTGSTLRNAPFLALCPPHEPQPFIQKVVDLLRNPTERDRLARNGAAAYQQHYSWSVVTQRLHAAIQRLPLP